ncbi:MAG: hypothetical protein HDR06_00230 [Lachnospiraceae bacterium]|nr:hypothetical protein [Lachnospiraceae bacterium]
MEKMIQGSLGVASAFHPHQKGFREKLSRYISFEEELGVREEKHMIGLGLSST